MRLRSILVCVFLLISGQVVVIAEEQEKKTDKGGTASTNTNQTNDQIEVKEDRFSAVTTITLKPQLILDKPDHQITMSIECKLGEKGLDRDDLEKVSATANFESQTKSSVDFGDQELHFLIDGNSLNFGRENISVTPYAKRYLKPGFKIRETFLEIFDRSNIAQFSKANRIEMRIGTIELTLSQPVVALLREYCSKVLAQHKIIMERKQ